MCFVEFRGPSCFIKTKRNSQQKKFGKQWPKRIFLIQKVLQFFNLCFILDRDSAYPEYNSGTYILSYVHWILWIFILYSERNLSDYCCALKQWDEWQNDVSHIALWFVPQSILNMNLYYTFLFKGIDCLFLLFIIYLLLFIYVFVFVCLLFYDIVTGTLLTEALVFFCPYLLPSAVQ